jgi:hypothetical protein
MPRAVRKRTIIAKGEDYVLGLKANQGTLHDDVKLYFEDCRAARFKDSEYGGCNDAEGTVGGGSQTVISLSVLTLFERRWVNSNERQRTMGGSRPDGAGQLPTGLPTQPGERTLHLSSSWKGSAR